MIKGLHLRKQGFFTRKGGFSNHSLEEIYSIVALTISVFVPVSNTILPNKTFCIKKESGESNTLHFMLFKMLKRVFL